MAKLRGAMSFLCVGGISLVMDGGFPSGPEAFQRLVVSGPFVPGLIRVAAREHRRVSFRVEIPFR